jgi:hypothetical protein
MIEIMNTLVSEEVLEKRFVCDLAACKGECCVQGDAGAPLEDDELSILDDIFEDVKPFLRQEGIDAIEKEGKYVFDWDGEAVTPLINGAECAYTTFDDDGVVKCGIEAAFRAGKTDFMKPISCHLYPIRLTKLSAYTAVNFNYWKICKPACVCGEALNVPTYKFLATPLKRKFGEEWYEMLCEAAKMFSKGK